jgi:hypothetical protein
LILAAVGLRRMLGGRCAMMKYQLVLQWTVASASDYERMVAIETHLVDLPPEEVRVAYRELAGSDYTILWPAGLMAFSVS